MKRPVRDSALYDDLQRHLSEALKRNDLPLILLLKRTVLELIRLPHRPTEEDSH